MFLFVALLMRCRASRRISSTLASPFASPSTSSSLNRHFATTFVSRCPSSTKLKRRWPGRRRPWPKKKKSKFWWPRRGHWSASTIPLAPPARWWMTHRPAQSDLLICRTSSNGTRWISARSSQRPRPCPCRRRLASAKITLARLHSAGLFPGTSWWIATCSWSSWASASCASLAPSWRRWVATWPPISRWRNPRWSPTLIRFWKRPTVLSFWPFVTWPRTAARRNSRWVKTFSFLPHWRTDGKLVRTCECSTHCS